MAGATDLGPNMEELAANEPVRRARKWQIQIGPQYHWVFVPTAVRVLRAPPVSLNTTVDEETGHYDSIDRYQLSGYGQVGRVFELCPEFTRDQIQSTFNNEVDELQMDAAQ